jgi:lycopene cyclase domain-containing protein
VARHLTYLGVLVACLLSAAWVDPVFRLGLRRRWRRVAATVVPVAVVFCAWDVAAIAAGHWTYDPAQTVGVTLPGRLPLEELLFFLIVPVCAILGFEAVRTATGAGRIPGGVPSHGDSDLEQVGGGPDAPVDDRGSVR